MAAGPARVRPPRTPMRPRKPAIPTLRIHGPRFIDAAGRHVLLRGVNLGGDSKLPYPDGGTHVPSDFSDHREVSFVGRPFPLDEAREHFGRLRHWGFNCLRLVVTWEAVEHAGPGCYDQAFLDYLVQVLELAEEHGLLAFIDFHQDVWSRMSGGSGAPGWTFEAAGLDFTTFDRADAALVMQHRYDYASPLARQEDRYPMMSWADNYRRPANGIMWTAFFAGSLFTPRWQVDGSNIEELLQGHYLGAIAAVAERVAPLRNVIGFDSLNEPGLGWIGQGMCERPSLGPAASGLSLPGWSPLDGLRAAAGQDVEVPLLRRDPESGRTLRDGSVHYNRARQPIWRDPGMDPFERHGAWRRQGGDGVALDEDFFRVHAGRAVDLADDVFGPFFERVARTIRAYRDDWLLFAELNPYTIGRHGRFPERMPRDWVNANHWYDLTLLRTKRAPQEPLAVLRDRYAGQLATIRALAGEGAQAVPTLIGEFGIPFDLDEGAAYQQAGLAPGDADPWRRHHPPLQAAYDAMDALLLSSTLWNYTASNRNCARIGDGWNQEDLSIFSRDQQHDPADPDSGARALDGFCRPYVRATQGVLRALRVEAGALEAELELDPAIPAPTLVYLPRRRFPQPVLECEGEDLAWEWDADAQLLRIHAQRRGCHRIRIRAQRTVPAEEAAT